MRYDSGDMLADADGYVMDDDAFLDSMVAFYKSKQDSPKPRSRCRRFLGLLWWLLSMLANLWLELFSIKLNKFGFRHWQRGDYELAAIAALTQNLNGLGVIFDVILTVLDCVESFTGLPATSGIRFIYYAIALTQAPIQSDVNRDAMLFMILAATDRLPLIAPIPSWMNTAFLMPLVFITPHACNTLSVLTMPIQWALLMTATVGWGFHVLRLIPSAQPSRKRVALVMFLSLTIFILDVANRTLATKYVSSAPKRKGFARRGSPASQLR
jgi:hypothetical protein